MFTVMVLDTRRGNGERDSRDGDLVSIILGLNSIWYIFWLKFSNFNLFYLYLFVK